MQSNYLKYFEGLADVSDSFRLVGDYILVEQITEEEKKSKGGIILADTPDSHKDLMKAEKPVFCHVLSVGEGYYNDETGDSVALDVEPGDIILVGPMSVTWFKTFGSMVSAGTAVGITRQSEIKMHFNGVSGYKKVFEVLGGE